MSNQDREPFDSAATEVGRIRAPWERTFEKILTPFEEFIHRQTTGGMVLMISAVVALMLANSGVAAAYQHLIHLPAHIGIGAWGIEKTLHHWVNDGLMALFFFVVGLELKREMLVGELANPRHAVLPILAAIGGMLVPALIYTAFNGGGDGARGWGIPMATDIAFSIGVVVLLAGRVPRALITFLVALAIVDDLGAVMVIAVFYTEKVALGWLAGAALVLGTMLVLNLAGVRRTMPYFLLATVLWYLLLESGIHATLAGVLGAFTVPARPSYDPALFSQRTRALLARFDASHSPGASILTNDELRAVAQALGSGAIQVQAPLQRLEHLWNLPVAFLVVPVFALFNAGIPLDFGTLTTTLTHPVTLGVTLGLVVGKFIGITGVVWLALKLGIGELPRGTRLSQIAGVSLLGGIGFTMSIFIAELGFAGHPDELLMAKTGVLLASLIAGFGGYIWLRLAAPATPRAGA
ncbi:MAG: Na+/H+ antiporter NhaA [Porticoccaceae bacterium]